MNQWRQLYGRLYSESIAPQVGFGVNSINQVCRLEVSFRGGSCLLQSPRQSRRWMRLLVRFLAMGITSTGVKGESPMSEAALRSRIGELAPSAGALAAIGAALRLRRDGSAAPIEVQQRLDEALAVLGAPPLDGLDAGQTARL